MEVFSYLNMINFILLLNLIVSLVIFIFLIVNSAKFSKIGFLKKVFFPLFLLGLVFLLSSILFFAWTFNLIMYASGDLLLIYAILTFLETLLLLIIIFSFRRNRRIFYLLFIYLFFIILVLFGLKFSNFLLISSFLLITILFVILLPFPHFTKISKIGIFYSSLSLFLQVILLFQSRICSLAILVSNIFFFIFIYVLVMETKKSPMEFFEKRIFPRKNSYVFDFLRYFVFIIILTNFIFIGVLAVHEGGHFVVSKFTPGCSLERIVYEGNLPHTEILCNNSQEATSRIILGGILIPIIISLLFFFGGGTFMKEISMLIFGFNIVISYKDFIALGLSENISTFFSIFGSIIILLAIGTLAKSRTTEEEFIRFGNG